MVRLFEIEVGFVLLPDKSYKSSTSAITNICRRKELVHWSLHISSRLPVITHKLYNIGCASIVTVESWCDSDMIRRPSLPMRKRLRIKSPSWRCEVPCPRQCCTYQTLSESCLIPVFWPVPCSEERACCYVLLD